MKIIYVSDILCPWCYGFDGVLESFMSKHHEIAYELVMGGLFTDQWVKPISDYASIADDTKRIEEVYPVKFGQVFYDNLNQGSFLLDSTVPDHVFTLMREHLDQDGQMKLAAALSKKFFFEGCNMNEKTPYFVVIDELGLHDSFKQLIDDHFDERDDHDFKYARDLHVEHFPTLLLKKNDQYLDLKGNARSLHELELNYRRLLGRVKLAKP